MRQSPAQRSRRKEAATIRQTAHIGAIVVSRTATEDGRSSASGMPRCGTGGHERREINTMPSSIASGAAIPGCERESHDLGLGAHFRHCHDHERAPEWILRKGERSLAGPPRTIVPPKDLANLLVPAARPSSVLAQGRPDSPPAPYQTPRARRTDQCSDSCPYGRVRRRSVAASSQNI
jgi:hypothetical protein